MPEFLLSLVPIAFVYALAHYFSLFVTQGQYIWPLLSDPFGRGWDLLRLGRLPPEPGDPDAAHDLVRAGRAPSSRATSSASPSPTTAP